MAEESESTVGKLMLFTTMSGFGIGVAGLSVFNLFNPEFLGKAQTGIVLAIASVLTTVGALKGREAQKQVEELVS